MDHNTETLAQENATGAEDINTENQAEATKTYTQEEVDNMMARMKGSLQRKLLKPYEDLGDPDELRQLKTEAEQRQQEQQIKRGEFEKTLQELAAKKDAEIQKRDEVIREYKVNSPLLDAAAKFKSVNPNQVRQLLSSQVRLNDSGNEVEVLDSEGNVRYTDSGTPLSVDDYVKEFLDQNPHFVQAGVATTNSKTNIGQGVKKSNIDLTTLDLSKPENRKIYAEARKSGLLDSL